MSITPGAYRNEVMGRRDETRPRIGLNRRIAVSVHVDAPPKEVWEVVYESVPE